MATIYAVYSSDILNEDVEEVMAALCEDGGQFVTTLEEARSIAENNMFEVGCADSYTIFEFELTSKLERVSLITKVESCENPLLK